MMQPDRSKLESLRPIFYPRSVAVVGASNNRAKAGASWLRSFLDNGYPGPVYPVNPREGQVAGLRSYPTVDSISGPVDLVCISVPREALLEALEGCARKGVAAVQIFAAGFKETGEAEGARLEDAIVETARRGGFRVIGPNCTGIYNPAARIALSPYPPTLRQPPGTVGFLTQSGGHASRAVEMGAARGLAFSQAVSFGNGCDLDEMDFLEYMAISPETRIIGAYLEGVKEGRRFFELLKAVTPAKPVVVLKGGMTEAGARTAASHTASLAMSATIWQAALRQAGAVMVSSLEELVDTLLAFQQLPPLAGGRAAVVSGLVDGGGGDSVTGADICSRLGLSTPPFLPQTSQRLREALGMLTSIARNPLDVSMAGGDPERLGRAFALVAADPNIEVIIAIEHAADLLRILPQQQAERINRMFTELARRKPLVIVTPPGLNETERLRMEHELCQAGIATYPTLERAARAVANLVQYYRQRV